MNKRAVGNISLSYEEPMQIPVEALDGLEKAVANMNIVLSKIILGRTISVKKLDALVLAN